MSRSARAGPTEDELDALEAMMTRMDQRGPSPSSSPRPRPVSQAFPSRSSSNSRLSTRSSNRSLQSDRSFSVPVPDHGNGRPPSALSRRSDISPEDEDNDGDNDTTPSMTQGEWGAGRPVFNHARSYTVGDPPQRRHDDSSSSIHSYASRDHELSHRPSPSRSLPTSPRTRPRTAPSPGTPLFDRTSSPLRLLPRSPLNDRTPLEDLTFFSEAGVIDSNGGSGGDGWHASGGIGGDNESIHSATSGRSANLSVASGFSGGPRSSSLRNARLREDIEKEAQRIKERASEGELRRAAAQAASAAAAAAPSSAGPQSGDLPPRKRSSVSSASNVPLYPGAPAPALSHAASTASFRDVPSSAEDTHSLRSVASTSNVSMSGTWGPSAHTGSSGASLGSGSASASGSGSHSAASARTEYGADRTGRARQKESREWSQTCWVWQTASGKSGSSGSSSSGGKFSKAPLLRDVPSVMKRKSAKRESAHHLLSPAEAILFNVEDSKKSKDKGKGSSSGGASPIGRDGGWRRATGVLRDDGHFRVFSDSDKSVLHSVHLPSLSRTDVRLVDHSLFGRPNCIAISRKIATPSTPHRASFQPTSTHSSSSSSLLQSTSKSDEPLYLCFPSIIASQVWLVMAHCFARPEYYLASGAATPRALRTARLGNQLGYPSDSGTESDGDATGQGSAEPDELESSCRIYRSLHLSINEGRALGELATEVVRPGPKSSWERPGLERGESDSTTSFSAGGGDTSFSSTVGYGSDVSPIKMPRLQSRPSAMGGGDGGKDDAGETFCEVEVNGEVVARTSMRKGSSPFWNEGFTFSDLPPFISPVTIRVLQSSKGSSRPHLLGTATVRIPDLPRHELVEDWWSIKPANPAKASDVVGELSLSLRIGEDVVLPSKEYQTMLKLLSEDGDAELATDIAHEFPSDLEEVTKILLRIYQADAQLVPRLLRLADLEVDGNNRNNRSTAILFRGNTILTKSVELYLRLIGAEYLDASIGDAIRRICAEKVEIEIDPMKMKSGWKDKELQANIHLLHEWTLTVWNSIYDAREKCPHDLRQIFGHIQRIVIEKYGTGEDQKNTRWTCVSAFIFLRFFVPAVLNPKLFFIVSAPPDPKSQRTLTLVAKTLQGLANFSSFGQKEPFMLPMNSFVQDNSAAFVDFIEHVSTVAPASGYRQEWTSPSSAAYLAPYRLRNSLPPLDKEAVPLLPHLIDLPRELGLLAAHIARFVAEKGPLQEEGAYNEPPHHRPDTPSIASSRGGRSHRFIEFAEVCVDVHAESRRRGGGLVTAPTYVELRNKTPDPKTRTKRAMSGRPGTASSFRADSGSLRKSFGVPSPARHSDELHIRNPAPSALQPSPFAADEGEGRATRDREESTSGHSVASRRSHRSFTINGPGAGSISGLARRGSFPPKSFSTEDLSLLASIQTAPHAGFDDFAAAEREGAVSPTPAGLTHSGTITSLASHLDDVSLHGESSFQVAEDEFSPLNPGPQQPLFSTRHAHPQTLDDEYSFPAVRSSAVPMPTSAAMNTKHVSSSGSTRSTSTTRSGQVLVPTPTTAVPTSRIRITQETTTTTSYLSDPSQAASGDALASPPLAGDDYAMSPTSPEDGTPYESSFGGGTFAAPLMRTQGSQASHLSGRSIASSLSSRSIHAEVSAGGTGGSPIPGAGAGTGTYVAISSAAGGLAGARRASSAGLSLGFGLGGSGRKVGRDDESEGGSSGSRSGGKGGLLSRAMGRKGSRAS
ncbi:hypothetical protein JCM10207_006649 [Rhodosporidiobolus poonsookiae]